MSILKPFLTLSLTGALLAGCGSAVPLGPEPPAARAFRTEASFGRATTKKGVGVDPINLVFIGTRWEVVGAFNAAGWVGADPITFANVVRQGQAIAGKPYPTAPFSPLYYATRPQDLAFQKNSTDIKQRDHLRIWLSDMRSTDGRSIWFSAASRDVGIEMNRNAPTLITHKVEADRDLERELVVGDMSDSGRLAQVFWLPGEPIDETKPFPVKTDGRIAVMVLKPQFQLFGW